MHRHFCDIAGHEYECSDESCGCICGIPMERGDHSDCPIELRVCPEHQGKTDGLNPEAESDTVKIDFSVLSPEPQRALPHCGCGCENADRSKIVGWCLHCDHVYVHYSPQTEARHFANNCPALLMN